MEVEQKFQFLLGLNKEQAMEREKDLIIKISLDPNHVAYFGVDELTQKVMQRTGCTEQDVQARLSVLLSSGKAEFVEFKDVDLTGLYPKNEINKN